MASSNIRFQLSSSSVPSRSTGQSHHKGVVYIIVDVSGSMWSGGKIQQVAKSVGNIIQRCPVPDVKFVVRSFSTKLQTVVALPKRKIDIKRMQNALINGVGGLTALFDCWAQALEEITYQGPTFCDKVSILNFASLSDGKNDMAYMLVFTDGMDCASRTVTMADIAQRLETEIKWNRRLMFIQAGPERKVADALKASCDPAYCSTINVEDTARGIQLGFAEAQKNVINFTVELDVGMGMGAVAERLSSINLSAAGGGLMPSTSRGVRGNDAGRPSSLLGRGGLRQSAGTRRGNVEDGCSPT